MTTRATGARRPLLPMDGTDPKPPHHLTDDGGQEAGPGEDTTLLPEDGFDPKHPSPPPPKAPRTHH